MLEWSEYWAHSPNEDDKPQLMEDHLHCVAEMAESFAAKFGAEELAMRVGWLHDIGKFSDLFQDYLRRCDIARLAGKKGKTMPGGGDHKQAGTRYASRLANVPKTDEGFLILGHHGGMPARTDIDIPSSQHEALDQIVARALQQLPLLQSLSGRAIPPPAAGTGKHKPTLCLEREFFLRMVFSCLVDADSLDTERHFNFDTNALRDWKADWGLWEQKLIEQQDRFLEENRKLTGKAASVAQVRREVYDRCVQAGRQSSKAFSLTVPTGGGKTLSSLAFALSQITHPGNRLERIIYAIPYTSIIDQTATVFYDLLGKEAPLLVHHSALPEDNKADGDGETSWRRLASQNWDAPLVVTTTVQLFESLFSNSPGRCRKLHNLTNSVIILDEAQMIPVGLLGPILDGLKLMVKYYGASVVFCTATQPAFDTISKHLKGFKDITPIIPPERQAIQFQIMKRVEFRIEPQTLLDTEAWTWKQVADSMRAGDQHQCLAIVNTRANALSLLEALNDPEAYHLSTLLCGAHRVQVLAAVRERLKQSESCRLVATQVIECGVDVDFPRALRAIGPLDRMVQAAGRCNREGLCDSGEVIFFLPAQNSMPRGEYATAVKITRLLLKEASLDLHDPVVYRAYFKELYGEQGAVATDKHGIQKLREEMNYPQVSRQFRMIDQDTRPVLVCYEPERERFDRILAIAQRGRISRSAWRQAQPLLVNLYSYDIQKLIQQGRLEELLPDALYLWKGEYDAVTHRGLVGIMSDPADTIFAQKN